MRRPSSLSIHESKSVARCDTLLWIRDNKLVTHIKIDRLNMRSNRKHRAKHSHKMFIIYSIQSSALHKICKTRNIINWSNNSLLVCNLIDFKNNYYFREYNMQLSRLVFYLNRHIPANLSKSYVSGELCIFVPVYYFCPLSNYFYGVQHLFSWMLELFLQVYELFVCSWIICV